MIKVGSDFSGVGAFNQALIRLGVQYKEVFACDMDKYARQTFIHNYGEPEYYPTNVYDREIPADPLDIYMTSPPCQAFSLAGKRLGKDDKRGILFFNSHEFIRQNNPRYFIFENVKGLLSDDNGNTFNEWVNMLGGKSVNGVPVLFPYDDAVPYHLYWKVLNAKNHGVPQNRERVFLIGIRDDVDNTFRWPIEERLEKRLKDVLEDDVDDKYFLSEKMVECIMTPASEKWQSGKMEIDLEIARPITATCHKMHRADSDNYIQVKSATSKGYEIATEGDSINLSVPNLETRRGRVGKQVAQTLDTACNQGVMIAKVGRSEEGKQLRKESMAKGKDHTPFQAKEINFEESDVMNCITTATTKDNLISQTIPVQLGNSDNRGLYIGKDGDSAFCIRTQQPNGVIQINPSKESGGVQPYQQNRVYDSNGLCPALNAGQSAWGGNAVTFTNSIRRLTPRECFRLMDFPDTFTWPVSDSQAYKQAGNSIVVNVLYKILKNLNL